MYLTNNKELGSAVTEHFILSQFSTIKSGGIFLGVDQALNYSIFDFIRNISKISHILTDIYGIKPTLNLKFLY